MAKAKAKEAPDVRFARQASALKRYATGLTITTQTQFETAGGYLRDIKTQIEEVHDTFDPICEKTNAAHKEATKQRKRHLDPRQGMEKIIKQGMSAYLQLEEDKRRRAQLEAEAEERKAEEKRRKADAKLLKKAGRTEEAESILDAPLHMPAAASVAPKPKVDGVSSSKTYKVEMVDLPTFARWAVETGNTGLLSWNQQALDTWAKAQKELYNVPGTRLVTDHTIRAKAQ